MALVSHKPLTIAFTLLAACATVHAELGPEDPPQREPIVPPNAEALTEARKQLAASDARTVAWGAWKAAELAAPELAQDVARAMGAARGLGATPGHDRYIERLWMLRSLCDAAVRTGATLPPADLTWLAKDYDRLAPAVAILVARRPAENVELLERWTLVNRSSDQPEVWLASANLLAATAPARLAPGLLPEIRIAIAVHVLDPDMGRGGSGRHSRTTSCGRTMAPEGFPPGVDYDLKRRAAKDEDVIAPGPVPIGFKRTVYRNSSFGSGLRSASVDRSEYALRLLRWMIGDRTEPGALDTELEVEHTWRDAATYLDEVGKAVEGHRAAWSALLAKLHERELLSAAAAGTPAPFTLAIEDHRKLPRDELPALPQ